MKFTLENSTGTKGVHAQSSHFSKLAPMMPFDLEIGCEEEDDAEPCDPHYIKSPRVKGYYVYLGLSNGVVSAACSDLTLSSSSSTPPTREISLFMRIPGSRTP